MNINIINENIYLYFSFGIWLYNNVIKIDCDKNLNWSKLRKHIYIAKDNLYFKSHVQNFKKF